MQCTGKAWSCRGFDSCLFHRRSWKMMYLLPMFIEIMCEAKFPRFLALLLLQKRLETSSKGRRVRKRSKNPEPTPLQKRIFLPRKIKAITFTTTCKLCSRCFFFWLSQFEKTYPEIYRSRLPGDNLSTCSTASQRSEKLKQVMKPLAILKNLRWWLRVMW